jgi:hypothetical protein
VQNLTVTFQSDKDPGNTFHRKWENNFAVGNFKGDIQAAHPKYRFFEKFLMKLDPIPPHPGNLYTFA